MTVLVGQPFVVQFPYARLLNVVLMFPEMALWSRTRVYYPVGK